MTSPAIALVVNPAANKGSAVRIGRQVADVLAPLCRLTVLSGRDEAESRSLIADAAAGNDAVFVCGGDGIVHLAVNALAESALVGSDTPLGVIPAGTGNDTALSLGIPADPVTAARALLTALEAGSVRPVDLGRCTGAGLVEDRWWISTLYGGFDSAVNERANALRWPRGKRRYDVAIVAELLGLAPRSIRLVLDGEVVEQRATLVAIGNGPQYAGGKLIAPTAVMDDGVFDVTVVGPLSRLTLARLAPTLPRAGHIGHPAVTQYRARSITFEAADVVAYADGERVGPLPLTTTCVPKALTVLVPVGVRAPGLA